VRIDELKRNYEIQVRWVAFPLHPETPVDGQTLEELFAGRSVDIEGMKKRLRQVADDLGLPLGDRKKTFNSRLAQELAKWAEAQGKGDPFHAAVFRAYYVDGKNIGRVDELVQLALSVGLSEEEARHVLESRTFKEAVDADWSRSHALGITAIPTFVIGHQAAVGFQPYDILEKLVKTGQVTKKS
jgi:predicted DsbA family dithiol-disulfide isomerase